MESRTFTFTDPQNYQIFVYKWLPDPVQKPKAVIQIAHGMAEMASRYERFAQALTGAGFIVYANDHRGHGQTAKTLDKIGYMGEDGFNWAVRDMYQLSGIIQSENPGLPLFLMGHSMGSFLTQQYISSYSAGLTGAILSGTSGKQGFVLNLGIVFAKLSIILKGAKTPSPLLDKMSFGNYNRYFKPNRTPFDWLSRDETEVDKYLASPYCGGIFSAGFYYDLFRGLKAIHRLNNLRNIPGHLPIYVFAGSMDPVGELNKSIRQLLDTYRKLRIRDVSCKFYPGGRHEMLNEINRDEVTRDVIAWLDGHLASINSILTR